MATLDKIMEMQKQGISDAEISTQLQNEGVAPTEINDSLNQAKIKNAVSPPENMMEAPAPPEMKSSIMSDQPEQATMQPPVAPTTPEAPAPPAASPEVYPPQAPAQDYPTPAPVAEYQPPVAEVQPQDNYYQQTPQAYSQQDYYAPSSGMDSETISEIAEQVVTEALGKYKKKVGDIVSFKNSIQDKVGDIDDRLRRIEDTIEKLQQAIIGKIGEFGESNAMIHKDLDNLHGTVSKLMNPLVDTYNELKKMAK